MTGPRDPSRAARRQAAIRAKQKTYDPGVRCHRGHSSVRDTDNDRCIACRRLVMVANRAAGRNNRGRVKDHNKGIARRPLLSACPPRPARCDCCDRERKLVLDHDHLTGDFRGWICDPCNRGLGAFGDDLHGALAAAAYMLRAAYTKR